MSFLSQLYRYRQREQRNPLEDYLTEALAEWLRQATLAGELRQIFRDIFKLDEAGSAPEEELRALSWQTQHVIARGHDTASNKRPDLIGRGSRIFVIIENKTWAPFTEHLDSNGIDYADQLSLYQRYLDKRRETYKGIVLLTHTTLPPPHWRGPVCYWRTVANYLARDRTQVRGSASEFMAQGLLAFLKEQNMGGTRIELADIVAQPAYDRLREGMSKLGAIGTKALGESLRAIPVDSLDVLRVGRPGGELAPPRFFGGVMTANGETTANSSFVLLCGVIARAAYEFEPRHSDLPELAIGLAIWRYAGALENQQKSLLDKLINDLNQTAESLAWQCEVYERDGYGPCVLVNTRASLMDMYQMAKGEDWDDLVDEFFSQGSKALLEALTLPSDAPATTLVRALYDFTGS